MIGSGLATSPFNRLSILANAPRASGVYAVLNPQKWIYIGQTGNIQARLFEHFSGDNRCITLAQPTSYQFELCPAQKRFARQDALILQLEPYCNRRLR